MTFSLHRSARAVLVLLLVLCMPFSGIQAATGTIMPTPFQTVLDTNGNPVSGAKICTYLAGTTTPTATYTDSALSVPNANPIVADSAGRFTAYLSPGAAYKFIYQDATGTAATCNGVVLKTVDNVFAVPATSANLDITGTAGEALTAGQVVYLSASQWFKADSATTAKSTVPVAIGMVPASITNGGSGTIRLAGQMTGLTLTSDTAYYIGTSGALTSTAPTNARLVGITDSTSTLIFATPYAPNADNGVDDFRLTLTTGTPFTSADVTGASAVTIFCTPSGHGNRIALYSSVGIATVYTSAEFSIAVPATTSQMYDIFAFSNSGVPTLELLAWTNDTTRATAIVLTTTGTYTKSGDLTRRYVGSFRTTTVSGQTEDSAAKRYLFSYYNRARVPVAKFDSTDSWSYTSTTVRQANGSTANQVDLVVGVAEATLDLSVMGISSGAAGNVSVGIGEDVTNGYTVAPQIFSLRAGDGNFLTFISKLVKMPSVGRHFYSWNESGNATNTFYGDNGGAVQAGLLGTWEK